MTYEKLNKPMNNSKCNDDRRVTKTASVLRNNAPKVQNSLVPNYDDQSKTNELKTQIDNNQTVAKLYLNVFTETANRSEITFDELKDAQVGHAWITLKFNNPASVLKSLDNPTRTLVEKEGESSMGFWPLIYRPEAFTQRRDPDYTTDQERASGYTPGIGASQNPSHSGFSFTQSVPGRVEEPDKAHQDEVKIRNEYDLTYNQVDSMLKYINQSRNKYYNLYHYNCTTFAVEAVSAAGQTAPSGSKFGICFPNALYKELYQNSKLDKRTFVKPLQKSPHPDTGRDTDVRHE